MSIPPPNSYPASGSQQPPLNSYPASGSQQPPLASYPTLPPTLPPPTLPSPTLPLPTLPPPTLPSTSSLLPKSISDLSIKCESENNRVMYYIFHCLMSMAAVYMAYKCNGKMDIGALLVALLCPYIYIIYKLGTNGLCDNIAPKVV
jgi:hypothetical protein